MNDSVPDHELVDAARQGDRDAWRQLMDRHLPALGAYIGARLRRPDVVDRLLVEACEAAWKYLDNLGDSSEFGRWFRKMGANVALRWHKSHPEEPLAAVIDVERAGRLGGNTAVIQELDRAIGRLKPDQRMAIEQRFRGGLQGQALWTAIHSDPVKGAELLESALRSLDRRLGEALA